MAASEATPNNPKNPEIITVKRLIGTCSPIAPPNTFKKNKNNTPIPNFTVLFAIKRIGLAGAPTNKSNIIKPIIIDITSVEFKFTQPLLLVLILLFMIERVKKELKFQSKRKF